MILTVGVNLIEINKTRTHGSKSACCSQSSEKCSSPLEPLEVSNTRRQAMTSARKRGVEFILNSAAVFSYVRLSSLISP